MVVNQVVHPALRDRRVTIKHSTEGGEQICSEQGMGTCADLSASYMGVLQAAPHSPVVLSHTVCQSLWIATEPWDLMAGLLFAMPALFRVTERIGDRETTEVSLKTASDSTVVKLD